MIDIKQYSNGRFFDAINRKYINRDRIKELIKKGEEIKITLTATGEEITEAILAKYAPKDDIDSSKSSADDSASSDDTNTSSDESDSKKTDWFLYTESMKNWISDVIDRRIRQVIEIMNLPTREQIAELNVNIKSINEKIDALEASKLKFESELLAASKPKTLKRNPFEEYVEKSASQNKRKTVARKTVEKKVVKRRTKKKI